MSTNRQQKGLFFKQDAFKATVKQRPFCIVATIGVLGINAIELAHPFGQIGFRNLDHQMVVIGHQHVALQQPIKSMDDTAENLFKRPIIQIIFKSLTTLKRPTG
jgi:hypothetical protein